MNLRKHYPDLTDDMEGPMPRYTSLMIVGLLIGSFGCSQDTTPVVTVDPETIGTLQEQRDAEDAAAAAADAKAGQIPRS